MFIAWLLWSFVLLGGLFMGSTAVRVLVIAGFHPVTALNAALYLGCALYALPRLLRLVRLTRSR